MVDIEGVKLEAELWANAIHGTKDSTERDTCIINVLQGTKIYHKLLMEDKRNQALINAQQ